MKYLLISLLCCLSLIPLYSQDESQERLILSTPGQLATLSDESDNLIGGIVHPLSGQPLVTSTDLVVKGAQNIILNRAYIPPHIPCSFPYHKHNQGEYNKKFLCEYLLDNYRGWQFFPQIWLEVNARPRYTEVCLSEANGMTLAFALSGPNHSVATLPSPHYAISNACGENPSGQYDPRNIRISYQDNADQVLVYALDGTLRSYNKKINYWKTQTCFTHLYLLEKETLPNGKIIKYHYDQKYRLTYVESLDPKERYVYASLRVGGAPREGNCHFLSSSGTTADYHYERRPSSWKIKYKNFKEKGKFTLPALLTSVSSPLYRNEVIEHDPLFHLSAYSGKEQIFKPLYGAFKEETPYFRIKELTLPVGPGEDFLPVYEFDYQPPIAGKKEGITRVKNKDGTATVYHFSKQLLTSLIQYYGTDGQLKKEKRFTWDKNNWLQSVELRDPQNQLLSRKSYQYDRFGNPIVETFTGDLSGNGAEEPFTTRRTFSEEGRNLLIREETDDGKVIHLSYLPNTNLITSKFTQQRNQIILREFNTYDDCHNLVQTISDDGKDSHPDNLAGVTQRILTNYSLRQQAPFLHMPEWIETRTLEQGQEKLLKRVHLLYNGQGNISEEEVYDSNNQLAYTLYRTYNERDDLISETNSLGQQAHYTYEPRGQLSSATNFSGRRLKTFTYDAKKRLRSELEQGNDGIVRLTLSDYDLNDRLIKKTDSFENSTQYTYDPVAHQVVRTDLSNIASLEAQPLPVTTQATYDPFGRVATKTDANGHTIQYQHNAYGSPTRITYPDGSQEQFRYQLNGLLASQTDRDGLTTFHTSDILGRILTKQYLSPAGQVLAQETYTYSGFHLLTQTNKEGHLTKFSYDGAGRKVSEETEGRITQFAYDPLGRLCTVCQQNGNNTLLTQYKRDLQDRIVEEIKTDSHHNSLYKISYTYDEDDNLKTMTRTIMGAEAIDTYLYDSLGRLIEHRDALGEITQTHYEENYHNSLGQKVLQTITTDPRQIITIETQDALHRTVGKEIQDAQKKTLSLQELIYDPHGNLTHQKDTVYRSGQQQNTQTLQYTHTSDHQIASLTRAFGTKEARTTSYSYAPTGQISSKPSLMASR